MNNERYPTRPQSVFYSLHGLQTASQPYTLCTRPSLNQQKLAQSTAHNVLPSSTAQNALLSYMAQYTTSRSIAKLQQCCGTIEPSRGQQYHSLEKDQIHGWSQGHQHRQPQDAGNIGPSRRHHNRHIEQRSAIIEYSRGLCHHHSQQGGLPKACRGYHFQNSQHGRLVKLCRRNRPHVRRAGVLMLNRGELHYRSGSVPKRRQSYPYLWHLKPPSERRCKRDASRTVHPGDYLGSNGLGSKPKLGRPLEERQQPEESVKVAHLHAIDYRDYFSCKWKRG